MRNPRPSAWALLGVLVASLLISPAAAVTVSAASNPAVCSPGQGPTLWKDELHPPDTIRVLRSSGPNAGHVETVDFWKYVGTVLRAEYSTGQDKPPLWMRIGALTVKQYGWYYAMNWRGAKKNFYDETGVLISTECYDVKDTTADQIYKDLKFSTQTNDWVPANTPSANNLAAMRETWHITMRKWKAKANKTRFFLSGYRSGKRKPCGADSTGYKIFQKSLRDCYVKNMTFEEVVREYFEPTYIVDNRSNDILDDDASWRGDVGTASGSGQWRLFTAKADGSGLAVGPNGSLGYNVFASGVGNVTPTGAGGANDDRLYADLVVLTTAGKLVVAHSTSNGLGSASENPVSPPAADRFFVADFNGDLLSDAGFLKGNGDGSATLRVMLRASDGSRFMADNVWWTGPLALSDSTWVAAGDVNGDGKADMIVRDASGAFSTAVTAPSCTDLSLWGPCPAGAVTPAGLGQLKSALGAAGQLGSARLTLGDFDRDGRDDVMGVIRVDANSVKVFGARGKADGTFHDVQQLGGTLSAVPTTDDYQVQAFEGNPDGMADLAVFSNGKVTMLRAVERTSVPASMVVAGPATSVTLPAGFKTF